MDLSGLSDPFCVVLWNGTEVGRTVVRHGTRDPDWAGDEGDGGFELPFFVPEADEWGEQPWPPMCLEVSALEMKHATKDSSVEITCISLRMGTPPLSSIVRSIHQG